MEVRDIEIPVVTANKISIIKKSREITEMIESYMILMGGK